MSASSAAEQQLFQHHLPRLQRSVFNHCQPLQPTALTSISHFIMSYHNSRRLAGSALLGVPWRCSQALLAGLAGLAVLAATTCSHPRLPAGVGGEAMGWAKPPHHIPPRSQSARPLSTPKTNRTKDLLQCSSGVFQAFCRLICLISVDTSNACPSMPRIFRTNHIRDIPGRASKVLNRV